MQNAGTAKRRAYRASVHKIALPRPEKLCVLFPSLPAEENTGAVCRHRVHRLCNDPVLERGLIE